jgi:hypothetical protein
MVNKNISVNTVTSQNYNDNLIYAKDLLNNGYNYISEPIKDFDNNYSLFIARSTRIGIEKIKFTGTYALLWVLITSLRGSI